MAIDNEYLKKYKRCINEYVSYEGVTNEAGEDDAAEAPQQSADAMGADPNAMGADPNAMGADPNAMGGDPNAMGASADGGENAAAQPPQGFAPQGANGPDMGADPSAMGGAEGDLGMGGAPSDMPSADDTVINIDDLTDSQKKTEEKIEHFASKFEKIMGMLDSVEHRLDDIDANTKKFEENLKAEIEKRNPTPQEKANERVSVSGPYTVGTDEFTPKINPEMSATPDKQYQITQDDVDGINDWRSIANSFDNERMGLKDILGY